MTWRLAPSQRVRPAEAPRIGLFGLLGSGNIGNDASMEAVLGYLRASQPDAVVDAMCGGPERLSAEYGVEAIPLTWCQQHEQRASRGLGVGLKVLGKGLDIFRTASWVRRHDVVIVPGMGVLEASLPLRALGFPYAMFLLCASGRLFGTKVALVSVGAGIINQRLTRWMFNSSGRLAYYRSYRDAQSRDAMSQRGIDTTRDQVYPDLVFGRPAPPYRESDDQIVGIGVMDYHGTNDDRENAEAIRASYLENMSLFIRWLIDDGRSIRLFIGDACDEILVRDILAALMTDLPDLDGSRVAAEPVSSFAELTQAMTPVSSVVAIRYHNVICALKLAKPTISLGYAPKNVAIMADAGLSDFCQHANSLDVDLLIRQFIELESRSTQLREAIVASNAAKARQVEEQFAELTAVLFPAAPGHAAPLSKPAGLGAV